jgi:hypothetical protein
MGRRGTVTKTPTRTYIGRREDQAQVSVLSIPLSLTNQRLSDTRLRLLGFPAVVTRFHLQTIPAFSHMRSSIYVYEKQHYEEAFGWVLKVCHISSAVTL